MFLPRRMMRTQLLALLGFAACALLCAPSEAQTLRTMAADSFPKYYRHFDAKGERMQGLCVDVIDYIREKSGLQITGHEDFATLKRIESELDANRLDFFCAWVKSPERVSKYLAIEVPVLTLRPVLVIRANDAVDIRRHDELHQIASKGVFLSVPGTELEHTLRTLPDARIDVSGKSIESNLLKLLRGDGRYFFYHDFGAIPTIRKMQLQDKFKVVVLQEDQPRPQYLFFSRSVPSLLVMRVDAVMREAQRNGELARIAARYITP